MVEVHPIVEKALKCIDEIYPSENTLNETFYPTEAFIDEMVRWVIDVAPIHELQGVKMDFVDVYYKDKVAYIAQTFDWGRVIYVKFDDWVRPATIINYDDIFYRQQMNKVLRGNPSRPIVVLTKDGIEAYRTNVSGTTAVDAQHVPYNIENIPTRLEDVASWKLAEIVLMSMSDAQNAAACTSRVNELLMQLSL
jgi:hypothetical protein